VSGDDAAFREQLDYLLERSPLYRDKLGGLTRALGLADIAELPLTDKRELRATVTPENPFGAHLCAAPSEIVRIYSTSGTTGTPSYIPLTAGDLENWVTGSARSYGASGVTAGQRIVSTYGAGPFVAGAALAAFERLGLCHIPVGTGDTERLLRAVATLKPEAVALTPSYAAYAMEAAAERGKVVLTASAPGTAEIGLQVELLRRELTILGVYEIGLDQPHGYWPWTRARNRRACLRLLAAGGLRLDHLISHVVPYTEAEAMVAMMARGGDEWMGIVFAWDEAGGKRP
jgi:hypothetical protein